jgi:hypothetical protein
MGITQTTNLSSTGVSARSFFLDRTRFECEGIAGDLLGGFGFDVEGWAEFGLGEVSAAWLSDLRAVCYAWERGY